MIVNLTDKTVLLSNKSRFSYLVVPPSGRIAKINKDDSVSNICKEFPNLNRTYIVYDDVAENLGNSRHDYIALKDARLET